MCGGFTCSKRALVALNILYVLVAFVLIGVAVYGRASAKVVDLPIVGGILACGVFLILISILGLIGAVRHHQVVLFFYMVILFMLFLVQFSVACACLSVNKDQQRQLAKEGWCRVSPELRREVENVFHCCGFDNSTDPTSAPQHVSKYCSDSSMAPHCIDKLQSTIEYAFELCGGIGLFFSFTEVIAAWVACRYRNQFDPAEKAASYMFPRNRIY